MALSPAQSSELASLNDALLRLRTGKLVSKVVYNGQETDFSKVDLNDLRSRVTELTDLSQRPDTALPIRSRGAVRFRL